MSRGSKVCVGAAESKELVTGSSMVKCEGTSHASFPVRIRLQWWCTRIVPARRARRRFGDETVEGGTSEPPSPACPIRLAGRPEFGQDAMKWTIYPLPPPYPNTSSRSRPSSETRRFPDHQQTRSKFTRWQPPGILAQYPRNERNPANQESSLIHPGCREYQPPVPLLKLLAIKNEP